MEQDLVALALTLAAQYPSHDGDAQTVHRWVGEALKWRADKTCPQPSTKFEDSHEVVLLRREGVGGSSGNSPSLTPRRLDSPSVLPK